MLQRELPRRGCLRGQIRGDLQASALRTSRPPRCPQKCHFRQDDSKTRLTGDVRPFHQDCVLATRGFFEEVPFLKRSTGRRHSHHRSCGGPFSVLSSRDVPLAEGIISSSTLVRPATLRSSNSLSFSPSGRPSLL